MIGIFDSGVGGLCSLTELCRLMPYENIIYLADRENAPYGIRSRSELIGLCNRSIGRLIDYGAELVLMACCTASTVHSYLDVRYREISVPIIAPTAAVAAKYSRVAVIGTAATVRSRAFSRQIGRISDSLVKEFAHQELVGHIEGGCRDGNITESCLACLIKIVEQVRSFGADALILGCTHFTHLIGELSALLPEVAMISPAHVGAAEIYKRVKDKEKENGRLTYT